MTVESSNAVHEFEAEVWLSDSVDAWAFVTVPEEIGDEIRMESGPPRGFGSVRVEVTMGTSTWRTSVFPDKVRGFVLPVKKAVRRAEGVDVGDVVKVSLRVS